MKIREGLTAEELAQAVVVECARRTRKPLGIKPSELRAVVLKAIMLRDRECRKIVQTMLLET